jgi:hypothetical protein
VVLRLDALLSEVVAGHWVAAGLLALEQGGELFGVEGVGDHRKPGKRISELRG